MIYSAALEIPSDTKKIDPATAEILFTPGILKKLTIQSDWGCRGFVQLRILHGETQIFPANMEEWFTLFGGIKQFDTEKDLTEAPNVLKIEGCSPKTLYWHYATIDVVIEPVVPVVFGLEI